MRLSPRQKVVLQLLRQAGSSGVTTADFLQGGAGSRFGGRILELRQMGFVISTKRVRSGMSRYVLLGEPEGRAQETSFGQWQMLV